MMKRIFFLLLVLALLSLSFANVLNDSNNCLETLLQGSANSHESTLRWVVDNCAMTYQKMAHISIANIKIQEKEHDNALQILEQIRTRQDGYGYDATKSSLEAFFNEGNCEEFTALYRYFSTNYRSVDKEHFSNYNSLCQDFLSKEFNLSNENINLLIIGNESLYQEFVESNEELNFLQEINMTYLNKNASCRTYNGLCDCSNYDYLGSKYGFDKTIVLTENTCRSNVIADKRLSFSSTYSQNSMLNFNYLVRLLFSNYLSEINLKGEFSSMQDFLEFIEKDPVSFDERLKSEDSFKSLFFNTITQDFSNNLDLLANLRLEYYFEEQQCKVVLGSANVPELNGLEVSSMQQLQNYKTQFPDATLVLTLLPQGDVVCSSYNSIMRQVLNEI